jgi:probable HAF family extracellular repeat protein
MALVEDRDVRGRGRLCTLVTGAVVSAAFAVASSGPAWGQVTGDEDGAPANTLHAFLLDDGEFTTIKAPGARVELAPFGINNRGQIVGEYIVDASKESGFVRDRRGRFARFDVPGAKATAAVEINDRGQIVGSYSENTAFVSDPNARLRGFLLDRGQFTRIDVPGAVGTQATGINNRGQVVGEYEDAGGTFRGFLWEKGRFKTFDEPEGTGASFTAINDRGQIIGVYVEDTGTGTVNLRGFLLSKGVYTTFDAEGVPFTVPNGINNRGQIAGYTAVDLAQTELHGFLLANGVKGPFTPIDVPGAASTAAFGINDRGQIVGGYANPDAAPDDQPGSMQMPMMMSGSDG